MVAGCTKESADDIPWLLALSLSLSVGRRYSLSLSLSHSRIPPCFLPPSCRTDGCNGSACTRVRRPFHGCMVRKWAGSRGLRCVFPHQECAALRRGLAGWGMARVVRLALWIHTPEEDHVTWTIRSSRANRVGSIGIRARWTTAHESTSTVHLGTTRYWEV